MKSFLPDIRPGHQLFGLFRVVGAPREAVGSELGGSASRSRSHRRGADPVGDRALVDRHGQGTPTRAPASGLATAVREAGEQPKSQKHAPKPGKHGHSSRDRGGEPPTSISDGYEPLGHADRINLASGARGGGVPARPSTAPESWSEHRPSPSPRLPGRKARARLETVHHGGGLRIVLDQ